MGLWEEGIDWRRQGDRLRAENMKLRKLIARAIPLIGHALDVPQKQDEARDWYYEASEALVPSPSESGEP